MAASAQSVIVGELNVNRSFRRPDKTNPELVVHADRVLSGPVTLEGFQIVTWRRFQIQLATGNLDQIRREALADYTVECVFGSRVPESPDHPEYVSDYDTVIKGVVS
jgi:hypothetical protein